MKLIDSAFDEFLSKNKEEIYNLFQKWRIKDHRFQTGTKIKIDSSTYILASVDGCTKYVWTNIDTGTTWGGWFENSVNPIEELKEVEWELIYPVPVRQK